MADEYFHDELSPENKKMLEEHTKGCEKCAARFESERIYYNKIKSAEYKINIAESVMDKIISGQMIVNKPAKKRFVPFGLISAAAIVLVLWAVSRDNIKLYDNMVNENALIQEEAEYGAMMANDNADAGGGEAAEELLEIRAAVITEAAAEDFDVETRAYIVEEMEAAELQEMPAEEAAHAPAMAAEGLFPAPSDEPAFTADNPPPFSEIIKVNWKVSEDPFEYLMCVGDYYFTRKEYKDALIENLKIYGIYYEIEITDIESEFIEIIYMD
jgi:hypothetical protein